MHVEFEIMTADGQPRWVWEIGIPVQTAGGEVETLEGVIVDITPRKFAQKLVPAGKGPGTRGRDLLELLLEPDLNQSMARVLARLGQDTGTDRVYVFRNHTDKESGAELTSQAYEWARPGIPVQIDNPDLQNLPMNEITPRWLAELRAGRSIKGMVSDFLPRSE